jgi:hypothetical protein
MDRQRQKRYPIYGDHHASDAVRHEADTQHRTALPGRQHRACKRYRKRQHDHCAPNHCNQAAAPSEHGAHLPTQLIAWSRSSPHALYGNSTRLLGHRTTHRNHTQHLFRNHAERMRPHSRVGPGRNSHLLE